MQLSQLKRGAISAALFAAAMTAGTAHAGAGSVTLDVTGISSNGALGDASNETRYIDILSNVQITGIAWSFSLTTNGSSWLSEMGIDLNNGAGGNGVSLFPGLGDNSSGSGDYSGSADLIALGVDFFLGADGRLNFEFFEAFDDFAGADGMWTSGSLTVNYVPEPSSFGLAALAMLGVGAAARRRKS